MNPYSEPRSLRADCASFSCRDDLREAARVFAEETQAELSLYGSSALIKHPSFQVSVSGDAGRSYLRADLKLKSGWKSFVRETLGEVLEVLKGDRASLLLELRKSK